MFESFIPLSHFTFPLRIPLNLPLWSNYHLFFHLIFLFEPLCIFTSSFKQFTPLYRFPFFVVFHYGFTSPKMYDVIDVLLPFLLPKFGGVSPSYASFNKCHSLLLCSIRVIIITTSVLFFFFCTRGFVLPLLRRLSTSTRTNCRCGTSWWWRVKWIGDEWRKMRSRWMCMGGMEIVFKNCTVLVVRGPTWFLNMDKTSQSWHKVYGPKNWA